MAGLTDFDVELVADIKGSEGFGLTAYPDTFGNWTCGYGHKLPALAPGKSWAGFTVIQSTADGWLDSDLRIATAYAQKLPEFNALDTDCRQNAVVELVFNMGSRWMYFAKCRASIQVKDWQGAHDQLLWNVVPDPANGVVGIPTKWEVEIHATRVDRIANYLLTGQYPSVE